MGEFGEEGYKRRGVLYVGKNGLEGGVEAGLDGVGREGRKEGEDEDGTADSSPSSSTPYTPILLKTLAFQSAGSLTPCSLNTPTSPCTRPLIAPSTSAITSPTTLASGNLAASAAAWEWRSRASA